MKISLPLLLACLLVPLAAMNASSASQAAGSQAARGSATAASDSSLSSLLAGLQATAQKSDADLARLHIDRWKADSANRQQAQASADSIHRNLVNAVPDLLQGVQAAPSSSMANFRLYRDLNALYETFSALAESAGAFGSTGEYSLLSADLNQLDHDRQQLAERVDLLAGANDAELARLRAHPSAAPAKAAPGPSKVVVDDTRPIKKKRKSPPTSSQP